MLPPILENDITPGVTILKDAMDEIYRLACRHENVRILRFPIDFYDAAVMNYARLSPFKSLVGPYGLNTFRKELCWFIVILRK